MTHRKIINGVSKIYFFVCVLYQTIHHVVDLYFFFEIVKAVNFIFLGVSKMITKKHHYCHLNDYYKAPYLNLLDR